MSEPQAEPGWMQGVRALVGKEYGRGYAWDEVNAPMIRQWCEMMGIANPAYTDPATPGGIVAPAAMLQAWCLEGAKLNNYPLDYREPVRGPQADRGPGLPVGGGGQLRPRVRPQAAPG